MFALCIHCYCLLLACTPIFSGKAFDRFDIVISEILADPTPRIELPESEFIELKNVSTTRINLQGYSISDGSSTAIISQAYFLEPGREVILCSQSAVNVFRPFGAVVGVSNFPALGNESDLLVLRSPDLRNVHTVAYAAAWFQNDLKSDGGWSLEMIDPANPCQGSSNWKASTDPAGGTPGKPNSVNAPNPDVLPPALLRTYTNDSTHLVAVFDEPLDSGVAANAKVYTIDHGMGAIRSATPLAPMMNEVLLQLPAPLRYAMPYQLTVREVRDCSGNIMGALNTAKAGLPALPGSGDIIFNEILFNPPAEGYDYIELYNRSNHVVDLQQLVLSNRSPTGGFLNNRKISELPLLCFPGEYRVVTTRKHWLQQFYLVKDQSLILECASLPSMPDDKGSILLTNLAGVIIDELRYDASWHFALMDNPVGIALERINYQLPTQDPNNWTSAASTVLYGTPGLPNSQLQQGQAFNGAVTVHPRIFSPNHDGFNDFTLVQFQMPSPGHVANVTVFDLSGRPVRRLANNALLGIQSALRWDGLDDQQRPLPTGAYIIFSELFHLQGKMSRFRSLVTLTNMR